ncbi:MAG TPA: DNA adenine methylase [Niabella sp.]|nr:DNA adenine methylase [Flavobacterium sp.]HRB28533.1 DNA adenine methylase [Niabella sp.]HRB44185.1 DNA adenine methylase [Niabella sp.]HRB60858.1 DNA adenine methylase [Niabella sp.]
MFSYYGSKSKIVDLYPPPKHKKIIEPFCGSARYSLKYWQNDVLIMDKSENLINVWKWLQQCSKNDILKLPKLTTGLDIRKIELSEIERTFLSYLVASGRPSNIVTKFMDYDNGNQKVYKRISDSLDLIRHWEIKLGSYDELENIEATWFIDPPYMFGGEHYKESNKNIDFGKLAEWCKNRNGQTIVCENMKADWLDFKPLTKIQGACQTNTTEAIWSNHKTNYDNVQVSLF